MLIQSSYLYVLAGLQLRMLQSVQSNSTKNYVLDTIKHLSNAVNNLDLQVTKQAMEGSFFIDLLTSLKALPQNETGIGDLLANQVRKEAYTLERIVYPESSIRMVYAFPERRFNTNYLLNSPNKLFKDDIFNKFDDIARQDIVSSCRCLLFGEATASAFHILRATEAVLKSYYLHHKRQKRLTKPMWAGMVDQLKAKKTNGPPITLLNSLDNIRTGYRNPTQHPEATYEIESAQDLFGVCIDVMSKMGREL